MLIQWCLKGIPEQNNFSDREATNALNFNGLSSSWLRNQNAGASQFSSLAHPVLSQVALDAHVNGFGAAAANTPYMSLTAGCVELDPTINSISVFSAMRTALDFATKGGQCRGYVFRMWVIVSPKPAPELPGFAEEVRELNLFQQFCLYHREGEVAAKLFVPARQIQKVMIFDRDLIHVNTHVNPGFVPPERISNVMDVL